MDFLARVDDFVLFEVGPEDELTPGTIGVPYYPGTILVIPADVVPELGKEVGWSDSKEAGEILAKSLTRSLALMGFEYKIARARQFADAYARACSSKNEGRQ